MATIMTESPDSLAFAPVPTASTRHDGWTPERQRRFIAALAAMGSVAPAARAVGKSTTSVHALRDRPGAEEFAAAWTVAQAMGRDRQYEQAMDRALNGYAVPRFRRGQQVGTVQRIDYRLAFAAMRQVLATTPAGVGGPVEATAQQPPFAASSPTSPAQDPR